MEIIFYARKFYFYEYFYFFFLKWFIINLFQFFFSNNLNVQIIHATIKQQIFLITYEKSGGKNAKRDVRAVQSRTMVEKKQQNNAPPNNILRGGLDKEHMHKF